MPPESKANTGLCCFFHPIVLFTIPIFFPRLAVYRAVHRQRLLLIRRLLRRVERDTSFQSRSVARAWRGCRRERRAHRSRRGQPGRVLLAFTEGLCGFSSEVGVFESRCKANVGEREG